MQVQVQGEGESRALVYSLEGLKWVKYLPYADDPVE
jgi:hypothetical protein